MQVFLVTGAVNTNNTNTTWQLLAGRCFVYCCCTVWHYHWSLITLLQFPNKRCFKWGFVVESPKNELLSLFHGLLEWVLKSVCVLCCRRAAGLPVCCVCWGCVPPCADWGLLAFGLWPAKELPSKHPASSNSSANYRSFKHTTQSFIQSQTNLNRLAALPVSFRFSLQILSLLIQKI